MQYYGFVPKGRHYAEVLATKEPGKASTDVETGVVYPTFKEAETATMQKNVKIQNQRIASETQDQRRTRLTIALKAKMHFLWHQSRSIEPCATLSCDHPWF